MSDSRNSPVDTVGDDELIEQLGAFGKTLDASLDQPIVPAVSATVSSRETASITDTVSTDTVSSVEDLGRRRGAYWLVAAVLLVAAGFGLGRLWPEGGGTDDGSGVDVADSVPEDGTDQDIDSAPTTSATTPPVAVPSVIVGADGTELARFDDIETLAWWLSEGRDLGPDGQDGPQGQEPPSLRGRGDIVALAVIDELARLEVLGTADPVEVADRLAVDGLTIATTLDPALMATADQTIDEVWPENGVTNDMGLLTVDNRSGAIVALASNRTDLPVMTGLIAEPGSAFKPVVLAAAMEAGYQLSDFIDPTGPCSFETADGQTYFVEGRLNQPQSLTSVTLSSNNCAYVRLGDAVGLDRVVELAESLGLPQPEGAESLLSLPLGTTAVRGVDITGAYSAFANGGRYQTPWLVASATDTDGQVVYEAPDRRESEVTVFSEQTAALVTEALAANIDRGTGTAAAQPEGVPAAGKTGTTGEFVDAWFVGYTPELTTSVWLGDADGVNRIRVPGWSSFGGGLPAAVWGAYMTAVGADSTTVLDPFPEPAADAREPLLIQAPSEIDQPGG
jgi:hypothetical protein